MALKLLKINNPQGHNQYLPIWAVPLPCYVTELHTDPLANLPVRRKQVAKLLLKIHQGALYPGIPTVNLVQPRHLRTGEIGLKPCSSTTVIRE